MEFIPKNIADHDFTTALLMMSLTLIVVVKYVYETQFSEFFALLQNGKYLVIYGKNKEGFNYFNNILQLVQIISLSLFVVLFLINSKNIPLDFIKCFLLISGYQITKFYLEKIIANIFNIDHLYDHYIFQKITYRNHIGILLFVLNILFLKVFAVSDELAHLSLIGIGLLYILSSILTYRNHLRAILGNLFYFILYLCALEIAPYILLYKLLV